MSDTDALEVPGERTVFVTVFTGPARRGVYDQPIPSRTRRQLQITTAHGIVKLTAEQAEALRDWLVEHCPIETFHEL